MGNRSPTWKCFRQGKILSLFSEFGPWDRGSFSMYLRFREFVRIRSCSSSSAFSSSSSFSSSCLFLLIFLDCRECDSWREEVKNHLQFFFFYFSVIIFLLFSFFFYILSIDLFAKHEKTKTQKLQKTRKHENTKTR